MLYVDSIAYALYNICVFVVVGFNKQYSYKTVVIKLHTITQHKINQWLWSGISYISSVQLVYKMT